MFKKMLALLLAFTMCISFSANTFALTPTIEIIEDKTIISTDIIAPDLLKMKTSLEEDPCVSSVTLNGNTLVITKTDGTISTIDKSINSTLYEYVITENNTTDILYINPSTNSILLNDAPVTITTYESTSNPEILSTCSADIYVKTTYPNIVAEQSIASIGQSTLYTLMFSIMGGIGVTLSLATTIISAYQLYDLASTIVYATRVIYRNSSYTEYLYKDTYYRNKNSVNYITTQNTTYYGS